MDHAHIWGSPPLREWNGKVILWLLHLVCDRELRTPLGRVLPHALGRGAPGGLCDSLSQAGPPPRGWGESVMLNKDAVSRYQIMLPPSIMRCKICTWNLLRFLCSSFCLGFSLYNIALSFRRGSFILSISTTENRLKAHKQTLTALRNHACSLPVDAVWQQVGPYQLLLRSSR